MFDLSFYFHPHFLVFYLSFLSMYSDDFDSVTNNLRDSAKGSNDGYDVAFPLTTSPSSSSQDSVFDVNRYTENRVPERSGSTSEELRGDPLHESTESENQNKNRESKEVQRDKSHELPDWLQECRKNVVDESTSAELR